MLRTIRILVIAALVSLALPGVAAAVPTSIPVSTAEGVQDHVDISGPKVVWEDQRYGYDDLYAYDLATGRETAVSTADGQQTAPKVSGDVVVAEDWRNPNLPFANIYAYPVTGGTFTPLELTGLYQGRFVPDVSGDWVVWQDTRNGNYDIYAYNMESGADVAVCTDAEAQSAPAIDGQTVVWLDRRKPAGANGDVYAYDLATRVESQVCTDSAIQQNPAVSGDWVVWEDYRNDNYDIYAYNLATHTESVVCTATGEQRKPAISGDWVVWEDYRAGVESDIYAYNLVSHEETVVCAAADSQQSPAISGDWVVWQDYRNGPLADVYAASLVPQPDVSITSLVSATTVPSGGSLSVTGTVSNLGTGDAKSFSVRYYLSADSSVSDDDIALGSSTVASLGAGQVSVVASKLTIPGTAAAGSYTLVAVADGAGVLTETSESNNVHARGPITVTGPANDAWAAPTALSGLSGSRTSDYNFQASKEAGEPKHAGVAGGKSVWYRWTAPTDGVTTIDLAGSSFDTVLGVYTGSSVGALSLVVANDDVGARLQSKVTVKTRKGVTYYIAVDGFEGAAGRISMAWRHNAVLSTPAAPASVYLRRYFAVTGTLTPRHTANVGYPITLTFERLVSGRVVSRKVVKAKVANYGSISRYSARVALTARGTWRVRASHADSGHALTYSAYRSFKVR